MGRPLHARLRTPRRNAAPCLPLWCKHVRGGGGSCNCEPRGLAWRGLALACSTTGETLGHTLLLFNTPAHQELLKALVVDQPGLLGLKCTKGAHDGQNLLHGAISAQDPGLALWLIEQDTERVLTSPKFWLNLGSGPLHYAVCNKQVAVVRKLLALDTVDLAARDGDKNTVLHLCVLHKHKGMYAYLEGEIIARDLHETLAARNGQQLTALGYAASLGHAEFFRWLLAKATVHQVRTPTKRSGLVPLAPLYDAVGPAPKRGRRLGPSILEVIAEHGQHRMAGVPEIDCLVKSLWEAGYGAKFRSEATLNTSAVLALVLLAAFDDATAGHDSALGMMGFTALELYSLAVEMHILWRTKTAFATKLDLLGKARSSFVILAFAARHFEPHNVSLWLLCASVASVVHSYKFVRCLDGLGGLVVPWCGAAEQLVASVGLWGVAAISLLYLQLVFLSATSGASLQHYVDWVSGSGAVGVGPAAVTTMTLVLAALVSNLVCMAMYLGFARLSADAQARVRYFQLQTVLEMARGGNPADVAPFWEQITRVGDGQDVLYFRCEAAPWCGDGTAHGERIAKLEASVESLLEELHGPGGGARPDSPGSGVLTPRSPNLRARSSSAGAAGRGPRSGSGSPRTTRKLPPDFPGSPLIGRRAASRAGAAVGVAVAPDPVATTGKGAPASLPQEGGASASENRESAAGGSPEAPSSVPRHITLTVFQGAGNSEQSTPLPADPGHAAGSGEAGSPPPADPGAFFPVRFTSRRGFMLPFPVLAAPERRAR